MDTREISARFPPIQSADDLTQDPEVWDLIVVGAGVAGSALAYAQGQEGRKVLLLERDLQEPDRIVGELLQPGGYIQLKNIGLAQCTEGIEAQKVFGYALFKNGKEFCIQYPLENYPEDVAGRSFHHGRFVQRLRQEAAKCPHVTVRQANVRNLVNSTGSTWQDGDVVDGVKYKLAATGAQHLARAHLTVVCDGMYSSLRSQLIEPDIKHPSYFLGIILKDVSLPYPGHGHVVLADPSPILLYPIGPGEVRVLMDVPGDKLPSVGNGDLQEYLRRVVVPQIPENLRAALQTALDAGPPRVMRNKQMPAKAIHRPGALLLGDSYNMRHPLTGGGMTVALADCNLLHSLLQPIPSLADTYATTSTTLRFHLSRKPWSATINTLANALYKVFCASQLTAHEHMRVACFDYLQMGGEYSQGPIALLGGLNPRPSVLVAHFFMVALFGVAGLTRYSKNPLKLLSMAVMLLYVACSIIFPIIYSEGPVAVFLPWLSPGPRVKGLPKSRSIANMLASHPMGLMQRATGTGPKLAAS